MEKVIGIASDHAGFEMKEFLVGFLMSEGYAVKDALARGLENNEYNLGIALCGSANGISMTLNKHSAVRAAICWTSEIAGLARQHNDANICSLPARFIDNIAAAEIVEKFLNTSFEGGRHQRRVDLISL
ncbi:MAG: RpiB/LacA/LacB family sugar-phosphate isomerase [Rikenellaceae bacterium]